MCFYLRIVFCSVLFAGIADRGVAATDVVILGVPDYEWHAGCFGTATGNLMGYWDRNGFPNLYTGPTGGGVAPLSSRGENRGIFSMWASQSGIDGRPGDQPGHIDDYWSEGGYKSELYESTGADPYVVAGRAEHEPDSIGDFIGLSQNKWTDLAGECSGNINAYSFVFWDKAGGRRTNYTPPADGGPPVDIQSGLRAWAKWRGYDCDVFTQLADFHPSTPPGTGFTFEDLKAEINDGYPVMFFLQPFSQQSRNFGASMPRGNPPIHGITCYGYYEDPTSQYVYYRTSWGDSCAGFDCKGNNWSASVAWPANLPLRGVIGFRPHPKVTRLTRAGGNITIEWDGPQSELFDYEKNISIKPHRYVIERADTLSPASSWASVSPTTTERSMTIPDSPRMSGFFRVKLMD